MHAIFKGEGEGFYFIGVFLFFKDGFKEGSVGGFELVGFWKCETHGELVGVTGVDTTDEGVDGVVEDFLTESAFKEFGDGFVGGG